MFRYTLPIAATALGLAALRLLAALPGSDSRRGEDKAEWPGPNKAVAALTRLGARIEREKGTIVGVVLLGGQVEDAHLAHLKGLTHLRHLTFAGTHVGDAGLAH